MDLTVIAIPGFTASMAYEAWWLKRRAETEGPSPVDYELKDTLASLSMGFGSLLEPYLTKRLRKDLAFGGRWAKPMLGVAAVAAVTAIAADAVARRYDQEPGQVPELRQVGAVAAQDVESPGDEVSRRNRKWSRIAKKVAGSSAVAMVAAAGVTATSTWAAKTSARKLFEKRLLADLGGGAVGLTAAVLGWDFIYYWNHRLQHESRIMWAIHVVHHSSEKYNLSTALRQTWADPLGIFVPFGALSLLGVRPEQIETARQLNLLYQYWIHTDTIRTIGPLEEVLNTASHHRVHHGMNRQYLDRNHGSIFIFWDKLFGTFEPEGETVRYGLTKNINTFNPLRIVAHEHGEIIKDVAGSDNWHDRLSFIFRGPGWAYSRHPQTEGGEAVPVELVDAELATA